jgi:hypothetical protein
MKHIVLAAVSALAFAVPASAATMTFSGVTTATVSNTPYVENGITMTGINANPYHYGYENAGTVHMDAGFGNGAYDFTFSGGVFDFSSIDVARSYGTGGTGTLTAFNAAGAQIGTAAFSTNTTGTYSFALTGVTRLRLVATGTHFNIDNLVLNASAVPEPATWGLMLAGFGLVGVGLRSRRRVATVSFG